MAKFDWDRETREARKRAHGSIPSWADPGAVSADDEREIRRLLEPMVEVVDEFAALSRTQRSQRASEFSYRLLKLKREAVSDGGGFANSTARDVLLQQTQVVVERLHEDARGA